METKTLPGLSDEAHPEVFNIEAMPPQPPSKPGQLPENQIRQFFEQGYVIVENFFDKKDLDACREAVSELVDQLANKLYNAGKIKDLYADKGLFERLSYVEKEFPGANIILHKYGRLPPAFKYLWTNERLLNVVEQLIGPNIAGHPVWNLRTKTPQNEATTVPWHQDVGYLDNNSYKVLQPTAWIPLLDADEFNGCMEVMRNGHRSGKVAEHQCCYGNTWYVMLEEEVIENSLDANSLEPSETPRNSASFQVPGYQQAVYSDKCDSRSNSGVDMTKDKVLCRVPYGGMLLLNNLVPHRSLPNVSNSIRWSLDLRWQKPSLPNGFYGLKQCVLFRSEDDPNLTVDWDTFENIDRQIEAAKAVVDVLPEAEDKDFDTVIRGPWMKKWNVVHMNIHTGTADGADDGTTWHGHKA